MNNQGNTALAPKHPGPVADAASLQNLTDAVEHAVMRDLVRPHKEGGLVLILRDSDGNWDSLPL